MTVPQSTHSPCLQVYLPAGARIGGALVHGCIVGFAPLGHRRLTRGTVRRCLGVHGTDRLTPLARERHEPELGITLTIPMRNSRQHLRQRPVTPAAKA